MAEVKQKSLTRAGFLTEISQKTNLPKQDVEAVFDTAIQLVQQELEKTGTANLAGLVKIERKQIPARPENPAYRNPFTKEIQVRPAKPASTKIKVRALKPIKDMA